VSRLKFGSHSSKRFFATPVFKKAGLLFQETGFFKGNSETL